MSEWRSCPGSRAQPCRSSRSVPGKTSLVRAAATERFDVLQRSKRHVCRYHSPRPAHHDQSDSTRSSRLHPPIRNVVRPRRAHTTLTPAPQTISNMKILFHSLKRRRRWTSELPSFGLAFGNRCAARRSPATGTVDLGCRFRATRACSQSASPRRHHQGVMGLQGDDLSPSAGAGAAGFRSPGRGHRQRRASVIKMVVLGEAARGRFEIVPCGPRQLIALPRQDANRRPRLRHGAEARPFVMRSSRAYVSRVRHAARNAARAR